MEKDYLVQYTNCLKKSLFDETVNIEVAGANIYVYGLSDRLCILLKHEPNGVLYFDEQRKQIVFKCEQHLFNFTFISKQN